MKQTLALILTALLLCVMLALCVLAAEEPAVSSDSAADVDSESGTDSDISSAAAAPSDSEMVADSGEAAPLLTVTPAAITLTSFDEPDRTDAVAFAVGTTREELSDWFADVAAGFTGYDADGNPYNLVSGAWPLEAVDTGMAGVYCASASPDLGTDYALEGGVSLPRQLYAVSIQVPGEPDINCCVAGRGFLHFPWVLSAAQEKQLGEFAVWLRQDGGEWTRLSDGFLVVSDGLQLSQRIFTYGSTYELKVSYPGGQTGALSFQYDGDLNIFDYSGGDRDGGDVNGGSSGTGTQPAPATPRTSGNSHEEDSQSSSNHTSAPSHSSSEADETPQDLDFQSPEYSTVALLTQAQESRELPETNSEAQEPVTVSEFYSPTQTVISGLRLKDLCKEEESVVFGSGDLTVSIPSKLLLALSLSDTDTLSVKLTQPQDNQIVLAVEVSGKSLTKLTGTVLRLHYTRQSENTQITVQNEAGEPITDSSYDSGLLRFPADAAGTYTILELSNAQEAQKGVPPPLSVTGGLILAAGGITFFRRRRRG